MLWEEYRPKTWKQFIGHEKLVASIKEWIETDSLPHLLFHGRPGTGKTALARLIRKYYLRKDRFKLDYEELNGSDDRGIDVIRGISKKLDYTWSGKKKIIYIDEAEQLTPDAWKAMKKILERFNRKAIFIFSTNNVSKIPDAIVSRCYTYEFNPHTDEQCRIIVERIGKDKGVEFNPETVDIAIEKSEGDLRKLIGTYLKEMLTNPDLKPEDLGKDATTKIVEKLKKIITKAGTQKPFEGVKTIVDTMKTLRKKFSPNDIISAMVAASEDVDVALHAGYVASWMAMSVPEDIALLSFAAKVVKCKCSGK
jgi:replication factor C small subunit